MSRSLFKEFRAIQLLAIKRGLRGTLDLCVILYSAESDLVRLIGQDGRLGWTLLRAFSTCHGCGSYVPGLTRVSLAATARSCDRVHPPQPAVAAYLEYDSLAEILLLQRDDGGQPASSQLRGTFVESSWRKNDARWI